MTDGEIKEQRRLNKIAYNRAYRQTNAEAVKARRIARHLANPEKQRRSSTKYSATHRNEIKAYNDAYRAKNAERLRKSKAAYSAANVDHIRSKNLAYYAANKERVRANNAAYYAVNREKVLAQNTVYNAFNRAKISRNKARYEKQRVETDPVFRLTKNLRRRLSLAFKAQKGRKSQTTLGLIGCSRDKLRQHLVSQFREGMTLENHGKVWHIDHIRPCSSFDLSDPNQAILCFHYSNLQPLFADENMRKGDRWGPTETRPLAA
jgi:hypothetical protein